MAETEQVNMLRKPEKKTSDAMADLFSVKKGESGRYIPPEEKISQIKEEGKQKRRTIGFESRKKVEEAMEMGKLGRKEKIKDTILGGILAGPKKTDSGRSWFKPMSKKEAVTRGKREAQQEAAKKREGKKLALKESRKLRRMELEAMRRADRETRRFEREDALKQRDEQERRERLLKLDEMRKEAGLKRAEKRNRTFTVRRISKGDKGYIWEAKNISGTMRFTGSPKEDLVKKLRLRGFTVSD